MASESGRARARGLERFRLHIDARARSRPPPRRCARRVARPSGRFSTRPSPRAFPSRAYSRVGDGGVRVAVDGGTRPLARLARRRRRGPRRRPGRIVVSRRRARGGEREHGVRARSQRTGRRARTSRGGRRGVLDASVVGGVEGEKSARRRFGARGDGVRRGSAAAAAAAREIPLRARDRGVGTRPRRRLRRRARRGVGGVGVRDEFRRGDEIGVGANSGRPRRRSGVRSASRGNRAAAPPGGLSDGARARSPSRGSIDSLRGGRRVTPMDARVEAISSDDEVEGEGDGMKATTPPRRLRSRGGVALPSRTRSVRRRVSVRDASRREWRIGRGFRPGSGSGPRLRRGRAR